MVNIGHKIKKIRELKNLTQEYMAHSLGMSLTGYGKIERDETDLTLAKLESIAKILEIDFRQIFDFDERYIFNIHNGNNTNIGSNTITNNERLIELLREEISYLRLENGKLLDILNKKV